MRGRPWTRCIQRRRDLTGLFPGESSKSTPPEEFAEFRTEGEWYWQLDDGHLPGGRYLTEDAAQEAAIRALEEYRAHMGGHIGLVTWVRMANGSTVDRPLVVRREANERSAQTDQRGHE